jgi:(p)ppGpp synthase/HD superfamily hydrolase
MKMLAKAIQFAAVGFVDKLDRAGKPYILHCFEVMRKMPKDDEDLQCIAILHDTVEDEVCTIDFLIQEGFSDRVIQAVELLTHYPSEMDYDTYVKCLAPNKDARTVKLADLEHNSQITRLKGVTDRDLIRMAKYHRNYTYLKEYKDEH